MQRNNRDTTRHRMGNWSSLSIYRTKHQTIYRDYSSSGFLVPHLATKRDGSIADEYGLDANFDHVALVSRGNKIHLAYKLGNNVMRAHLIRAKDCTFLIIPR